MKKLVVFCISLIFMGACGFNPDGSYNVPLLYKINIQQGNVIEQRMLDRLKPDMDKSQVQYIMGTPLLIDPFHNNRWEYVFSFKAGGDTREQRHITLHFNEAEKLSHITGDIIAADGTRDLNAINEGEAVIVPGSASKKKGFFSRLLDKVNPFEDE